VRDILRQYNAKGDPSVEDGRHTAQEAFDHFNETFHSHHKEEAREWCTFKEFVEYYTDWSALIESDSYFLKLVTQTWNLPKRSAPQNKRPSSAYNLRPRNRGGATYFSGAENNADLILPSTRYYRGRQSPIRKSIAYCPPRRDGYSFKETPGQSSNDFTLHNNNEVY